jgi:hypothetical protein
MLEVGLFRDLGGGQVGGMRNDRSRCTHGIRTEADRIETLRVLGLQKVGVQGG